MRIGFSFWGFLAPLEKNTFVNTPDGPRGDRIDFVNAMLARNHRVIRLQKMRDTEPYPGVMIDDAGFPELDVVYVEWRWPTWKNTGPNPSEPDYQRQVKILDYYHSKGVPTIIHDGDLKITPEEEMRWPKMVLSDPCIVPRVQARPRIHVPWCHNMVRQLPASVDSYNYVYIGNNYERDESFGKYYGEPSATLRDAGIQTMVHGNWLQKSPERRDPSYIVSRYPTVSFGSRLSFKDIFPALNSAIAVTHIAKGEYMKNGNITCRFHEAIASVVPSLIPIEYTHALPVGLDGQLVVKTPRDVVEKVRWLSKLSQVERTALVDAQQKAMESVVDSRPESRVDLLERLAGGRL